MNDPRYVLSQRDNLMNEVRELQKAVKEITSAKYIKVEGSAGSLTFTQKRVCEHFMRSLSVSLKEAEEELQKIEDRIAKWG